MITAIVRFSVRFPGVVVAVALMLVAYGIFTWPIHRRLTIERSFVAFLVFTTLMFGASVLKTTLVARWKAERAQRAAGTTG